MKFSSVSDFEDYCSNSCGINGPAPSCVLCPISHCYEDFKRFFKRSLFYLEDESSSEQN
jgi:hypothetical protein